MGRGGDEDVYRFFNWILEFKEAPSTVSSQFPLLILSSVEFQEPSLPHFHFFCGNPILPAGDWTHALLLVLCILWEEQSKCTDSDAINKKLKQPEEMGRGRLFTQRCSLHTFPLLSSVSRARFLPKYKSNTSWNLKFMGISSVFFFFKLGGELTYSSLLSLIL